MDLRMIFILCCFCVHLYGCSNSEAGFAANESYAAKEYEEADGFDQMDQVPPTAQAPPPPPGEDDIIPQRVLLREADFRMEVDHIADRVKHIEQLLSEKEGYVANMNWQHYSYQEQVSMTIRIPAKHFEWYLDSLTGLAIKVDHQQVSTQDVTEEYVDVQSRLKTKKAVRDRYEEILRTKAKTVEEILLAEEQIRRLQEEIEAKEGRLRYLSQRAAMSSIELSLYETIEGEAATSWWKDFAGDIGDSLRFSISIIKNLFLGLLGIWPVLLLLVWIWWKRKSIWKRIRGGE